MNGVKENVGSTGFPAEVLRLPGQFLGTGEITDCAPVVDEVGGRLQCVHVIRAQVVTASLQHMLAFLQRVPAMAGLAQRSGKPLAGMEPVDVLPAPGRLERGDHPARDIERFLI